NNRATRTIFVNDPWADLIDIPPAVRPFSMSAVVTWVAKESGTGVVHYGTTTNLTDSLVAKRDTTAHRVRLRGLQPETDYYYSVSLPDSAGTMHPGPIGTFRTRPSNVPADFDLAPPWPNPTTANVQLIVRLPEPSTVQLQIFDLQGRLVWADRERSLRAGSWRVGWPGTDGAGKR